MIELQYSCNGKLFVTMTRHIPQFLAVMASLSLSYSFAQDAPEEEVFEYSPGGAPNWFTGEGANVGGFLFPNLFIFGTAGVSESGASAEDYAFAGHDPLNDVSIQTIEADIGININDVVTGLVAGSGFQAEDHEWDAELEEAFLHYNINENIAIGGGQFLNQFGFQSSKHLHAWDFVTNNLVNARMLNEGELFTQGGEVVFRGPNASVLTIGGGGVRSHAHGHEEEEEGHAEEEEEHHGHGHGHGHEEESHEGEEEGHMEADDAFFNNWAFTAAHQFRLPFDDSVTVTTSVGTGENGFGGDTYLYGVGFQKVWNGHDHGNGGPDFCNGAFLFRTEFIGREIEAVHEDGDVEKFNDYGLSSLLKYGVSDRTTVALRHDWVSSLGALELADTHRVSPAFTTYVDPAQRVRMRFQYDYLRSSALDGEHVGWVQFQLQWGGTGGSHDGHNH